MRLGYSVDDLPLLGTGAFCPTQVLPPDASSWGLVERTGAPGTQPQNAPSPTRIWAPPISFDPATQDSNNAPDVTLRDVYVAYADNMGPSQLVGMTERRFNQLPLPAISWRAIPTRAMRPRKMGGRAQIDQPRAFQRFPNWATVRGFRRAS